MTRSGAWFERNVAEALADDRLRAAVGEAASKKMASRTEAIGRIHRFEQWRELAAGIKQHTLDHLDRYLDDFIARVEAHGGRVHLAATAEQANQIITQIAKENHARLCVKAKSMTSEETGLTGALEAGGVRVVETDLGEFIVQLDHDRPSHIVTPIIHKDRRTIAAVLARELGVPYTEDPEALTGHARRHLREIFRTCDLGVTGVNFAVAETGTLCICTNEGNGRLTLTGPRVHVALMGIEKLIPRMSDLAVFLKVLARASTGQPITVYTSLVSGPKRPDDPDGPEQLHVVILDGGRRRIHGSEHREVLRCIRCGACLNACPVYRRIGGHAYDNVYPGPIGKLLAPLLNDPHRYADLPQASSLCGLCAEVCPVKIDIPGHLVKLRRDQVADRAAGPWRRLAFRVLFAVLASPYLYETAQRVVRWVSTSWARDEWIERLPGSLGRLTRYRDLPRPAVKPFRQLWDENERDRCHDARRPSGQAETEPNRDRKGADQGSPGACEAIPDSSSPQRADLRARCYEAVPTNSRLSRWDRTSQSAPLPELDDSVVRLVRRDDDLMSIFRARAEELGMRVHLASSASIGSELSAIVRNIATAREIPGAGEGPNAQAAPVQVLIDPALFCRDVIARALAHDAEILDPRAGDRAMYASDVGITGVWTAVAETGSLVCTSGEQQWRGMSLIPPVHVAVVRREQILPDLLDLFARLSTDSLPPNVTLISGPSKTSDIAGILITGVHGPREVHVFVLEE